MKKVFFILILFLSCYIIYNQTIDNKKYYLTIGDFLSKGTNEYGIISYGYNDYVIDYLKNNNILKEYESTFTQNDYQIKDIINILEYNKLKDNKSLYRLIKKANIITISLGMNDIYNRLSNKTPITYNYIDSILKDYNQILSIINNFHHDKVYILGYYSTNKGNNDIINYANYKLEKLCQEYNYIYVDLSNILSNNPNYFSSKDTFIPNNKGYEKISQIIVEKLKNT